MFKKAISLISAVLFVFFSITVYAEKSDIMIDETYSIYCSSDEMNTVANKMAEYIKGASGCTLKVTSEESSPRIGLYTDSSMEKGYTIEEADGNVLITGSSFQQLVRGIYAFLEQFGGVKMYTSEEVSYTKDEISVPKGAKVDYKPYFECTDTDWLSPKDVQYSLFNGFNSAEYRDIPKEYGGCIDYISSFAHTLTNQFCSSSKYYEEHPEYFALYRGIRTNSQLCLSNPDVLKIVTQEVLDLLEKKWDPNAELQIVSLTQHDNIFFCSCPKCRATDKKYGSHAGTMLEFVNAVAREVKARGYDNVAIDTFAYRYTRKPPKGIVPEDNVIVRLCSIECCFSHALDDKSCKANKSFMEDLDGWSKICSRIYIWDYCTNYANWVGPFPDFGTLQKNMQMFSEHNVRGIYEEGNYAMKAEGEFGELRSWLIGQLCKNPYIDYDAAITEFCDAYYGAAGKYVKKYLDLTTENQNGKHLGIYQSMKCTFNFTKNQIAECDELWAKAEEAVSGKELEHVKGSELSWRWWKMETRSSEFSSRGSYDNLKQTLMDDISAKGITSLYEMEGAKRFFVQLYQDLCFKVYFLIAGALKLLYII